MRRQKKRHTYGKLYIVMLALVLLCASGVGVTLAKYIYAKSFKGTVTFTTTLAEDIQLKEHQAQRKTNGSYELTDVVVTENTYLAMPGVDIPKDPYFEIRNKSSVDAYLFVEVVEDGTKPNSVSYELSGDWAKLDGAKAKHGGAVYVYTGGGSTALPLDEDFGNATVKILKDDIIYVSETMEAFSEFQLEFYGYMIQSEGTASATEAYKR